VKGIIKKLAHTQRAFRFMLLMCAISFVVSIALFSFGYKTGDVAVVSFNILFFGQAVWLINYFIVSAKDVIYQKEPDKI
jgi:hypothetical protein